jgi:Ni/Co efflux regulator RcnB
MRRLILTFAAVASVATALPVGDGAWAQGRGRAERQERGPDRDRGERQRGPERERRDDRDRAPDRRAPERRADEDRRRDARAAFGYERRDRDERRGGRWDDDEPPRAAPRRSYEAPAPSAGARRGFTPQGYRGPVVEDFRRYRLRPPPHGYAWVRMGDGFALISLDDGQVFDRVR